MKCKNLAAILLITFSTFASANDTAKQQKMAELADLMNMSSMVDTIYTQMEGMMLNLSQQMDIQPSEKPIFDAYYKEMTAIMKQDMSWEKMEPMILDIYSRNFTEKEIDDLVAFYKTPTGQSVIRKLPMVTQESMQVSEVLVQSALPKIQALAQKLGQDLEAARAAQ